MYSGSEYVEVEESLGGYGDIKSWVSSDPTSLSGWKKPGPGSASNLDRVLYNDLVEIVPLVQSLIERKASSSYTRKGSMTYTKTPSRNDPKNKNAVKSTLGKKQADKGQGKHGRNERDGSPDDFLASSVNEKDREEMRALREELEDLRRKLVEKDELLKSAEMSKKQTSSVESQVDELKHSASGKDSLMKATQLQLNDAKIKLADKQASLEKLQWEAKTSNQKVEKLQEELDSMQSQISSFMLLFEALSKDRPIPPVEDYDIKPSCVDRLPDMDDMDESEMQKMEEARQAYIAAVAVAKEKQDEESLVAASRARLHLQSFVFRSDI